MSDNPLLSQLGYTPDARLVIFHADDMGMCHGANQAFMDLLPAGIVRTGSVMTPCPWSEEILKAAAADPTLDLGVHLTLNSEWSGYRWGPLSTRDPASGLVDAGGWFWPRPPATLEHLNVDAAAAELRAQVAHAVRAGLDITHIDAHMGTAFGGPLFAASLQLAFEYRVPILFPRTPDEQVRSLLAASVSDDAWRAQALALEARGMPLVDTFRITPGFDARGSQEEHAALYETILRALPSGVTYFSLHPNAPGDIEVLAPESAHRRTFEHAYFKSQRAHAFLVNEGIIPIGMRELRAVLRAQAAARTPAA